MISDMSMQDPISNMLSSINNAQMRQKPDLTIPSSTQKINLVKLLKDEGYIEDFSISEDKKPMLTIRLKYFEGRGVIKELNRISKPGLRRYFNSKDLPLIKGGLGIAIVSTNQGLMTDEKARKKGIGGEVICSVF